MGFRIFAVLVAATLVLGAMPARVGAHGFAGKRFFPTTFEVEDPFVSDELSILSGVIKEPGSEEEPGVHAWETSAEFSKRITRSFALSLEGEFRRLDPLGGPVESGFGNLGVGAKLQFLTSEAHELVGSLAFEAEVGETGDPDVEAEPFSILAPGLFVGKGFGDLPDSLGFLRPLAVTAALSARFPTDARTRHRAFDAEAGGFVEEVEWNPVTLSWGFALQYNLAYRNAFVKQTMLPKPLDRIIPVVEFAFDSCLNRGCGGETTGTVNPGWIWFGRKLELGVAAKIPINERTGRNVGLLVLVHVFVDDWLPRSLGRPIFGE